MILMNEMQGLSPGEEFENENQFYEKPVSPHIILNNRIEGMQAQSSTK